MAFGLMDVAMTVFGNHPERTNSLLLQVFFSRFAIGSLAANRLPDAFALKACAGILGIGLLGALAGWVVKSWGA